MNIEQRLTRIEAHLFGKAEQPQEKERTFESFYVQCSKEQYPDVKRILEAQGYECVSDTWFDGEDCVKADRTGYCFTAWMSRRKKDSPTYTLPQLREKFGVEQPTEKLRDFVVPLAHATLTREEVAVRCVAAAEKKGYKADPDPDFSDYESHKVFFGEDQPAVSFETKVGGRGYGFYSRIVDHEKVVTLEAFEEYCGVEPPAQPVYDAGFVFCPKGICALLLPDDTELWYSEYDSAWRKDRPFYKPKPHALTPVETHTVGKFYAVKDASGEHLNDYRNYALCVKSGEWPHFVKPKIEDGIVVVESNTLVHVSRLEVTPI